jgi:DNA-binding MarR family transcriptional regulator
MLSRYLLVSRQNLSGLLTRLEREGHVERVIGEDDRRSRKVRLTANGEALWTQLAEPIHAFYDQALQGLSFDDRRAFNQPASARPITSRWMSLAPS